MGFVRDQEGIMNRFTRESSNWTTHLEKTRHFISGSFSRSDAETVAVLGSGWLLDVPLEHLVNRFKRVYLVDIHHPVQIRKKTASMNRVELIEEDLTGGAVEQIWQLCRQNPSVIREGRIAEQIYMIPPLKTIQPDAFISVNLLNQLDIFLCDYLQKRRHCQQESLTPLRAAIQSFHLEWISRKPGCLVTDTLEEVVGKNDKISFKALLHTGLPVGNRRESWWWEFDSTGTYHPGSRTRMEVWAVEWT
jgi:hypothetical protein